MKFEMKIKRSHIKFLSQVLGNSLDRNMLCKQLEGCYTFFKVQKHTFQYGHLYRVARKNEC